MKRPATPGPGPHELVEGVMARVDAAAQGAPSPDTIPTGFPSLDRVLGGGMRRQDLVVLAGDVGSGKSALALAIAIRAATAGVPTLHLSGEMSPERVLERALAIEGRAAIDDLRTGRLDDATRAAVGAAAVRLRDVPLAIRSFGDRPGEIGELAAMVPPRALVVVDSLQQVPPARPIARAEDRLAAAIRELKALAVARDLAILAPAHLPGHDRTRPDPRPTLDDLGGRGAVKQQADVVLGLYREEMYRADQGVAGATELIVAKNRNGPTGFVDLYFYARWLRFEDMLEPER